MLRGFAIFGCALWPYLGIFKGTGRFLVMLAGAKYRFLGCTVIGLSKEFCSMIGWTVLLPVIVTRNRFTLDYWEFLIYTEVFTRNQLKCLVYAISKIVVIVRIVISLERILKIHCSWDSHLVFRDISNLFKKLIVSSSSSFRNKLVYMEIIHIIVLLTLGTSWQK